jgi:hypothetical protein
MRLFSSFHALAAGERVFASAMEFKFTEHLVLRDYT